MPPRQLEKITKDKNKVQEILLMCQNGPQNIINSAPKDRSLSVTHTGRATFTNYDDSPSYKAESTFAKIKKNQSDIQKNKVI